MGDCVFQEYILKGVVNAALGQEMGSVSMKSLAVHTLPSSGNVKTRMDVQPMTSSPSLGSSAGPVLRCWGWGAGKQTLMLGIYLL